jgi:hypothetical protein
MAEIDEKLPHGRGVDANASTQRQGLTVRLSTLNMVPLIPHVQIRRLNLQVGRFAIPVGDPRMVKPIRYCASNHHPKSIRKLVNRNLPI